MSLYSDLQSDALAVLKEFGAAITLRSKSTAAYDPTQGASVVTTVDTTRYGVAMPFGAGQEMFNGQTILTNDKKLFMDASASAPKVGDLVQVNGAWYSIISFTENNPSGTAMLYVCHIRT